MGHSAVVHTSVVHKIKSINALNPLLFLVGGGRIETSPVLRSDDDDFVDKSADQLVGSLSSCASLRGTQMKWCKNLVSFALVLCPCFDNDNAIKGVVEPRDPYVKMSPHSEVQNNFSLIVQTASAHCSNAASPKQLCVDIFPGSPQEEASVIGKVEVCFSGCWIYCLFDQTDRPL